MPSGGDRTWSSSEARPTAAVHSRRLAALEPQVALLGMRMGGLAGPEVLNAVIRDKIPTRVVFLSSLTESGLVFAMFSRGAAGYIDKASSAEEICNAIAAVSRGEMVVSPTVEGGVCCRSASTPPSSRSR